MLNVIMLSVFKLNVVKLSVITPLMTLCRQVKTCCALRHKAVLGVIFPNAFRVSVVVLIVVAPRVFPRVNKDLERQRKVEDGLLLFKKLQFLNFRKTSFKKKKTFSFTVTHAPGK